MFFKHILWLFVYVLFAFHSEVMAQSDLYGDCIKGYDMGALTGENISISPINKACQSACKIECESFSRKSKGGLELNGEAITECMSACQSGNNYSGYLYEEYTDHDDNGKRKVRVVGPTQTRVSCSASVLKGESIASSSFLVSSGDKISLRMLTNSDFNKIYMCGKRTFYVTPMITSLDPKVWNDKTSQTVIKKRDENLCAIMMPNDKWASLTNYSTWSTFGYQKCNWNARNPYYTDTGIWIKDGDEVSIAWEGVYFSNSFEKIKSRKDLFDAKLNPKAYDVRGNDVAKLIADGGALHVMPPGQKMNSTGFIELLGESARVQASNSSSGEVPADQPKHVYWYGLKGSALDMDYKVNTNMSPPDCDSPDKRMQNHDKCIKIDNPGIPVYSFFGILKGFSQDPVQLALRHFDKSVSIDSYNKHVGGMAVTVSWGGCPIVNGQRLQYAFAAKEPSSDNEWQDVTREIFADGKAIVANRDGYVFLRVKPMEVPASLPDEIKKYYTDPAHRHGQYYVSLMKLGESGFKQSGGPIREIVNTVREVIYGTDKKTGVLEKLYNALIKESAVIASIRAVLIFYIAFNGLGYLIGTVQANRRELFIRVIKFAIVATIISPTSWEFFSGYFYKAFMDGGLELIALIGNASLENNVAGGQPIVDISEDPAQIFAVFDGPFKMMFSRVMGLKLYALFLSGVFGVILVMVVGVAMVYYFLSIVKAVMMFLMSMIIIALLIFIGPLFLCFMLFNFTKQFFDSWWKYLVSFTLQPVVLFTSIVVFNLLIVLVLMYTFSFTICPGCLLKIYIPNIVDFCIWPSWNVLALSHYPDSAPFFVPPGAIEGSIILLLLAQSMYAFCEKSVEITNVIISGAMINATNLSDYGGHIIGVGESALGLDRQSIDRREIARQKKQAAESEKMQKQREMDEKKDRNNPAPKPKS
ncbi:MAG: type IV secretion system protein [Candidatus Jidaibacter sp.]|jgi:type IV secretion system protein VirB6|nr:type IV secretion system protein [Candidatus Jidaibacter sp.]